MGAKGKSRFRLIVSTVSGLTAILLVLAPPVTAGEAKTIGKVRVGGGDSSTAIKVLVPLDLPLDLSGRPVAGRVTITAPGGKWSKAWNHRAHAGSLRLADRRTHFRFVVGVQVPRRVVKRAKSLGKRLRVKTKLRFTRPSVDGSAEPVSVTRTQRGLARGSARFCETAPRLELGPEVGRWQVPRPVCGKPVRWRLATQPETGQVESQGRKMIFRPSDGARGADTIRINGFRGGRKVATQLIQLRLGGSGEPSVVALGDSVTAGFGYFGATGKPMTIEQLIDCRPGATVFNDACSSNSYNRNSSIGSKPDYLPDFGLARNISWAAQWANQYAITDYRNYAVTGSAPTDWLPGGQFNATLEAIQQSNPDYILMTMGANPLLSDVLFGIDNMGCALESDLLGDYRQCVLDAFASVDLSQKLNQLYTSLVDSTTSQIVLMQYHLTVPSVALAYSSLQIEEMIELLNEVIASEAASVSSSRIKVVSPPRFNVGIDMEPLYPSNFSCSMLGYKVDGPSVQSTPTQDELEIDHPLSFCSGPAVGPPWIISGDTGIHPSAAGYFQMAGQIPAPGS